MHERTEYQLKKLDKKSVTVVTASVKEDKRGSQH
jgi:hypothetical protein